MRRSVVVVPVILILSSFGLYASQGSAPGPKPSAVIEELKQGNGRFAAGEARHPEQKPEDRQKLVGGQSPPVIVLSCSDSRVPPELVFDQGLGKVFAVRVAGNIVDAATVASIEYAVEHLGAKAIVVMGHESCGAVKAALETPVGQTAGSRDLDMLVGAIRTNLAGRYSVKTAGKTLREPVKANVKAVVEDLIIRSKIVREHVESGKVALVPAIYSIETGFAEFWKDSH